MYDSFGELYAEYRSEMGRFGDAWPGAALQVDAARDTLLEMERTAELVNAISPPWLPVKVTDQVPLPYGIEEPF